MTVPGPRRRSAPALASLLALSIGLAACGSQPPSPAPSGGEPGTPAPSLASPAPTPGEVPPSEEVGELGAPEKIRAALARGEITESEAAVYRAFAAFGDQRLPPEFRVEEAPYEDHLALRDAAGMWSELSAEQRAALAPFFIPPIYAGSWADPETAAAGRIGAAPVDLAGGAAMRAGLAGYTGEASPDPVAAAADPTVCDSEQLRGQQYVNVPAAGGKVRIWWRNGISTSARAGTLASRVADEITSTIWPTLTTLMGREPLSDANVPCFNGEDGALDIYLVDRSLGLGVQALTIAYPGACKNTPTFIVFDAQYVDAGGDTRAWRYAHELFHAIQFTYDYAGPCSAYAMMDEATAMWAAEHVYPGDQFEWSGGTLGYGSWFGSNRASFQNHANRAAMGGYGDWPLFSSLTHRHGTDRMRLLYEATETVDSDLDAIEIALPDGIDGYWAQFVRDLWDDHEPHNVWRTWDPGEWGTADFDKSLGGLSAVNRPGGGGLLTNDHERHWRIAEWSETPCVTHQDDNPSWTYHDSQTVGIWQCALNKDEPPPPEISWERHASPPAMGRQEHEYWLPDDEWPRYLEIATPGLGVEDEQLSVQGFYRTRDGAWSGPHDWKTKDKVSFCRDDAAEDVDRVVILYGNSKVQTKAYEVIQGSYEVEAREACPESYAVTITYESTSVLHAGSWTIQGSLEPRDPSRRYPADQPQDQLMGKGTWAGSSVDPFTGRYCDGGQSVSSGEGTLWLTGQIVPEGSGDGQVEGPSVIVSAFMTEASIQNPNPAEPPYIDLFGLYAPAEGGSVTYRQVKMPQAECGERWEATVTVTVSRGG